MAFPITNDRETRAAVWDILEEPDGVLTAISSLSDHTSTALLSVVRPRPLTFFAVLGDSMASGDSAGAREAWGWANLFSGGGLVRSGTGWSAGVGGNITTQMLARVSEITSLTPRPHICIVQGGTNDALTAVPLATTKANLIAIYDYLRANGIEPVAVLIPPSDTQPARVAAINAFIAAYAAWHNMVCLDNYTANADADGTWRSGFSADGTHPTPAAARLMGQRTAAALAPAVKAEGFLANYSGTDASNLILNGLFVGDTNADGVANNWGLNTPGAHVSAELVAGTGSVLGNWQKVTKTSTGNNYITPAVNITTGFSAGDLMMFCGRVKLEGTAAAYAIDMRIHDNQQAVDPIMYQWSGEISEADGAIFSQLFLVPSGTTSFSPRILGSGSVGTGNYSIAQWALRNLTALGIV